MTDDVEDLVDEIRGLLVKILARNREITDRVKRLEQRRANPLNQRARCPACGRLTRITTAGCDHCGLEDK